MSDLNSPIHNYLLQLTGAKTCEETEVLQSLWSGYGKISRYAFGGSQIKTAIVKEIRISQPKVHPRGWNTNTSHQRKLKSYEVETHWYEHYSQHTNDHCKVPAFLGSWAEGETKWIVLEDLQPRFPLVKSEISFSEVRLVLSWLANIHAQFLTAKESMVTQGLWEVGTYWHLDTRPDEWSKIENKEIKAKAAAMDAALRNAKYQTLVHGDAKLANFLFSNDGNSVAAVDFQYVGGGCGMKDVAYFLGSCMSSDEMELYDKALLEHYFSELQSTLQSAIPENSPIDFEEIKAEWTALYPFAHADFLRFLLGWMPTHQKINGYNQRLMKTVLDQL